MNENLKSAFKEGKQSAKLKTRKQAIVRAVITGSILGIAIFAPYPIIWRIIFFFVAMFIVGIIGSSKRFSDKI